MSKKPTVLMILDGYGLRADDKGNAVAEGKTPVMDKLMAECPFVKGNASGMAVGLPEGQMGNSEVGHLNMGAGRIVYQDLTKITKSIQDGDFFENKALLAACENVKKNDSALHMMGLVSDGGVHSHNTHIYGLLELAKKQGIEKVYVHCFLDGRDTPPASGKDYVAELEAKMKEIGVGEVASVSGRYYAMDRDNRWDRVEKAYNALVKGEGVEAASALEGIQASYDNEKTDEFVEPFVVMKDGAPTATVKDGDSMIFFNFRPDRAREITRTFCDDQFDGFERGERVKTTYVCFTEYDVTIENKLVAFVKEEITNTFGEFLAAKGLKQARIAETEKYAHVTFFFNGGVEEPNEGEDRILVKSPKVATYDLKPEMSAYEVSDKLVDATASDAEVERVCKLAQADGFIREFPNQYETMIVEGGNNVSGGQKQRLCIARALLKKPKILILDDSTSAVDTKTDALIRQAFREEIPDTTRIIIAQRVSSVEDADVIIVMDKGEISGIGTSEELLKTNAIYREVYESQMKGGKDSE